MAIASGRMSVGSGLRGTRPLRDAANVGGGGGVAERAEGGVRGGGERVEKEGGRGGGRGQVHLGDGFMISSSTMAKLEVT